MAQFDDYNEETKLKSVAYGNGVATTYTYDPLTFRLSDILTKKSNATSNYMKYHYEYYPSGDMKTKLNNDTNAKYTYKYDTLHRLKDEEYTGGPLATNVDILNFTYPDDNTDMENPRTGYHPHAVKNVKYQFNDFKGEHDYDHDLKGNTTASFDMSNPRLMWEGRSPILMTTCLKRSFIPRMGPPSSGMMETENGRSRTRSRSSVSQKSIYIDENYEIINGVKTRYVFAGNVRVAQITGEPGSLVASYFHKDHLGSSSVMTDVNGNPLNTENVDYMAFGLERNSTTQLPTMNYRYTDQELDKGTGLYNYDARLYDPGIGMFVSADSVAPKCLLTPNRGEFRQVAGSWKNDDELTRKAQQLRTQLNLQALLVTRSEEGMTLYREGEALTEPALAREVFDVSGAGDTVIATLGVMLAAGVDLPEAMRLANRPPASWSASWARRW